MKRMLSILLFIVTGLFGTLSAQNSLNIDSIGKWISTPEDKFLISKNGRFFGFQERIEGADEIFNMVVRDVTRDSEFKLEGVSHSQSVGFTNDSRFFLYRDVKGPDIYNILNLSNGQTNSIKGVKKLIIPSGNYQDMLLYQNAEGELIMVQLLNGKKKSYGYICDFWLQPDLRTLLLKSQSSTGAEIIELLDPIKQHRRTIARGGAYKGFIWNNSFNKVAFIEQKKQSDIVWLYDKDKNKVVRLFEDDQIRHNHGQQVESINQFVGEDKSLELTMKQRLLGQPILSKSAKVNIWSYFDSDLQPNKLPAPSMDIKRKRALLNISSRNILPLDDEGNGLRGLVGNNYYGYSALFKQYFIISAIDGSQKVLPGLPSDPNIWFYLAMETGRYLAYFYKNEWYSYDLKDQRSLCLTRNIDATWYGNSELQTEEGYYSPSDWRPHLLGGNLFRVRDRYDIWVVDASGKKKPVCLTSHYGSKNKVVFKDIRRDESENSVMLNGKLLLSAIGETDGKAGFFYCNPLKEDTPTMLIYKDAKFGAPKVSTNRKSYFIYGETSQSAPNWFVTADFINLKALSAISPWYKGCESELIFGRKVNGSEVRSVLYRPKNFNLSKKYPVIVNYYEEKSQDKNAFKRPELIKGEIDIPWFLSNGYLVLQPDIQYRKGAPGQSALDCVNAAVDQLVKLHFVDSTKIGIQGHSFGGFETLYIVTHSNRFTAAMASAPIANLISFSQPEHMQLRMKTPLWENTSSYVENSPVLNADKVETPLLMMHNKKDENVEFANGMEFFTAMRRLGKYCWLLEYEDEGHILSNPANQKDYTIRMTQFFDHYLRGIAAPIWMIDGQRYRDAQYRPGYELDTLGRKPGPGINSLEEQEKIDGYSKIPLSYKLKNIINK